MPYNPAIHNRHSIRLPGYDYTQPGAYYLTILTHKKEHLLGEVYNGVVQLSPMGKITQEQWLKIPTHFSNVLLDAFVIMPNHIHGILVITDSTVRTGKGKAFDFWLSQKNSTIQNHSTDQNKSTNHGSNALPILSGSEPGSIPAIVQNFKSITSRRINKLLKSPGSTIWHRNYYEHIIRDEVDFKRIVRYIEQNPHKWEKEEKK
ncbi:MAG: transposase [Chloroflexi bacterium HGW-Chloroflexi-3]|nr:MAG: transposase [Chloroflexi bacterium HGW-Chloroflexi-3]